MSELGGVPSSGMSPVPIPMEADVEEPETGSTGKDASPPALQGKYDELANIRGQDKVDQAFGRMMEKKFSDGLIDAVKKIDELPEAQKNGIVDALERKRAQDGRVPESDVAEDVEGEFGAVGGNLAERVVDEMLKQMIDDNREATKPGTPGERSSGKGKGGAGAQAAGGAQGMGGAQDAGGAQGMGGAQGAGGAQGMGGAQGAGGAEGAGGAQGTGGAEGTGGSGGGSENWLVALAKVMGQISGKFLQKMVDKGKEIGALGGEGNEGAFAQVSAEMQGAAQMFKIAQESLAAVVKTAGEGLVSVARK